MKNVASKTRKVTDPYAWWISPITGWKYTLLKSWQGDNSKPYSRWLMRVEGWDDDMGDTYCSEARPALRDAMAAGGMSSDGSVGGFGVTWWFDDSVWSNHGEFGAWIWGER